MADRAYTNDELEAAVAAITDPGRLREAQNLVVKTAPGLERLLSSALDEGGWFDTGHAQAVSEVCGREDPEERLRELHTLLAEETRLGMLVGVAVGFELARELERRDPGDANKTTPGDANKTTPGDANKTTPGDANKTTPGDANKTTPGDANKTTPGDANKTTPGDANKTTQED